MPEARWVIEDSCLLLCVNNCSSLIYPKAKEIYLVEFQNERKIQGHTLESPSISLHGFSFSKFPLELKIKITIDAENPSVTRQLFKYTVVGKKRGLVVEIPNPLSRVVDHIVLDNMWLPFVNGSLEEVCKILTEGNIDDTGKLTLKQYFYLIQHPSDIVEIDFNQLEIANKINLKSVTSLPIDNLPTIRGKLYPYQEIGYFWLRMIDREDVGCLLADEMGLGKTVQIICLIAKDVAENKFPSLIIAPATLLENWRREFKKFTPYIKSIVHQGPKRTAFYSDLMKYEVVITSYDTIIRDAPLFKMVFWNAIILDEAQAIKNPRAIRSRTIKSIPRRLSVAVTGTPVENKLTDLWSILDFALPGFLGTQLEFERKFENDIECASMLEPLVSPFILRRTVKKVANDLPERIDIPQSLAAPEKMIAEYESLRLKIVEEYGASASFVSLTKLRMFCTHPFLLMNGDCNPDKVSPKYCRLTEILEEIVENGEKALVFTSFSKMIDILVLDLTEKLNGAYIDWIDGRITIGKRQDKVDFFNRCQRPAVLLLNPKAAGTGLNLTGANHVIHYNPEWNPAIEDQASARVYRRGQTLPVTIHRLFYTDTVEEVMVERLERKRDIAEKAVVGTTGHKSEYEDIIRSLEVTPFREV